MNEANTRTRYGRALIALHWLMLALLAAVYACIELRELFDKGSDPRETLKALHFMLGLSVLLLLLPRIVLRLSNSPPAIEPAPAAWQQAAARAMHLALYALMLLMPLAGWAMLSAAGKPIPFYGLELPPLLGEDKALAAQIKDLHETLGKVGYGLIALHAVAALLHHYVQRDNTLRRMLPGAD